MGLGYGSFAFTIYLRKLACLPRKRATRLIRTMAIIHMFIIVSVALVHRILTYNPFDDSMLYDISWAGPLHSQSHKQEENESPVFITTKDNEKYRCALPALRADLQDDDDPGPGPSPDEMLKSLTTNVRCSYRLETYWTYELCHGSHIRQYHDEKPVKNKVAQEYILGKINSDNKDKSGEVSTEPVKKEEDNKQPPKRNMNGREIPYYEIIMDNGTPCELLNGQPRKSHVIYMCKPEAHNEIIGIKEIETCVYQFEVLTPLLCANAAYNVKEDAVHHIRCHSLSGSPSEPHSYIEHIEESEADRLGYREYQYMPVRGETPEANAKSDEHRKIPPQPDQQLTRDFLNGDYCLRGGSGWWHYEYCHTKHVLQYHEDHKGKTIVYLGTWNGDMTSRPGENKKVAHEPPRLMGVSGFPGFPPSAKPADLGHGGYEEGKAKATPKISHAEWVKKHSKHKTSGQLTHFYGNGDICDITGKARTVQVRLRCMKSKHLQEVSIYLLEPNPCQYILGVDSPILCPLIEKADENGIFPNTLH